MTIQNATHTTELGTGGSLKVLRKSDWALVGFVNRVDAEWHASYLGGTSSHENRVAAFEKVATEDNLNNPQDETPLEQAARVLREVASSEELANLLTRAMAAQAATDNADDDWNTPVGFKIEKVMSYLRMTIEAAR